LWGSGYSGPFVNEPLGICEVLHDVDQRGMAAPCDGHEDVAEYFRIRLRYEKNLTTKALQRAKVSEIR